jgi:hypothetical protein
MKIKLVIEMSIKSSWIAQISTVLDGRTRPRGKIGFLTQLRPKAKILDVGCGNASPAKAKLTRPDIFYIGLYQPSERPTLH